MCRKPPYKEVAGEPVTELFNLVFMPFIKMGIIIGGISVATIGTTLFIVKALFFK